MTAAAVAAAGMAAVPMVALKPFPPAALAATVTAAPAALAMCGPQLQQPMPLLAIMCLLHIILLKHKLLRVISLSPLLLEEMKPDTQATDTPALPLIAMCRLSVLPN